MNRHLNDLKKQRLNKSNRAEEKVFKIEGTKKTHPSPARIKTLTQQKTHSAF